MNVAARCVDGLGVCVIPQPKNNHAPLALRPKPLAIVSALLITAKILALGFIALTPATAELSTITSDRIIQLTNSERKKAGLAPLASNSKLNEAARQKGQDMLEKDYFAHISPSGVTPWFWMSKVGYTYTVAGENLAIDFTEAEAVVAAWIASPSHKDNMLHSEYTETGVAVVSGEFQGGTSIIVVHMFGKPPGAVAAEQTPSTPAAPTPAATATPTPVPATPTPAPAAPSVEKDTTPPRTPRIAILNTSSVVQDELTVSISGDIGSTVHVLINNQPRANITLTSNEIEHTIPLTSLQDGTLTVRAYASDDSRNESPLTAALTIAKDTAAPEINHSELAFLLSPITDQPEILLKAPRVHDDSTLTIQQSGITFSPDTNTWTALPSHTQPLTLAITDSAGNSNTTDVLAIAPVFETKSETNFAFSSARFTKVSRTITASVLVTILILLSLAVFIRIRIQHPALVTHATLAAALAVVLLVT